MPFPWTLQRYIFREMGKACLLAAAGLTVTLSLGGGVRELIKLGEVTPGQFLRLLTLVIPISAALTLPVAVLFSAAATYGRLSADNEFVACRSSGINLHLLFLPALVLALLSACVTFLCMSFLIPGIVRSLDHFLEADVIAVLQRQLDEPRGVRLESEGQGYRITADRAIVDPETPNRVSLSGIAFLHVQDERWVRYGTARRVELQFDRSGGRIRASGRMAGLSFYDLRDERFAELADQTVAVRELPSLVPRRIKFLNVQQLFYYRRHPHRWHEVEKALDTLRLHVARRMLYDALADEWAKDRTIILRDANASYTVTSAAASRLARDAGIELTETEVREDSDSRQRTCHAPRAVIEMIPGSGFDQAGVRIDAYDARLTADGRSANRSKVSFGPLALPESVVKEARALSVDQLLRFDSNGTGPLAEKRADALEARGETLRRIAAALHERGAFSASVIALALLAAALGIIFRGSQVVVAFGISFIPSLAVIVTIVMGKQLAQNAVSHGPGLLLMWSGIAVVVLLDLWILARVVRR